MASIEGTRTVGHARRSGVSVPRTGAVQWRAAGTYTGPAESLQLSTAIVPLEGIGMSAQERYRAPPPSWRRSLAISGATLAVGTFCYFESAADPAGPELAMRMIVLVAAAVS